MKLRTITGTRWPALCADGCGTRIEPSADVKVVVDFESRPRRTWIPAHSPDAATWKANASSGSQLAHGSNGAAQATDASNGQAVAGFQPASALPKAPPEQPKPPAQPSGPSPAPLALLGSAGAGEPSPSASAGVDWATGQLTFNAGPYESAKAGYAAYALPGESGEQLRARVHRVVLDDLERQVRGIRELHERLGDVVKPFPASARAAGAPSGASAVPSSPPSSAMQTHPSALGPADASHLGSRGPSGASATSTGPGTAGGEVRTSLRDSSSLGIGPATASSMRPVRTRPGDVRPGPLEEPGPQSSGLSRSEAASSTCPRGPEVGVPDAPRQGGGASSLGGGVCLPSSASPSPAVADLVARVNLELTDTSVRRKRAKEAAARKMCELRGLQSLRECTSSEVTSLEALLATMWAIDDWDLHSALGVPPPQLDEQLVLPA